MRTFTLGMAAAALALTACTSPNTTDSGAQSSVAAQSSSSAALQNTTVRVLTHDSFALSQSVIDDFTAETGITVEFIPAGDAGEMVNRAVLASGNPEADVLFGIDTTLLSRAIDADVWNDKFVPLLRQIR